MFLSIRSLPRGLRPHVPDILWAVLVPLIGSVLPVAPAVRAQSEVGTLLEQARTAEKTGDYQAAERVYLQALVLAPGHLETLKRSEEHTSELQSRLHLVCRLLLE